MDRACDETVSGEPVAPCGVPKGRVGDYAESHNGLPPQTVFSGSERTWARFSPQIMRGIMRAVGRLCGAPIWTAGFKLV
jgi:hypothetical protein